LNDNFNQTLYVTQESNNKIDAAWTSGDETIDSSETWASNNTRVATTGAIDGRIDSKIDTALTTDVAAGNKITVTDNSPGSGQITVALTSGSLVNSDVNASAAIAGTKISPNFGSQNIVTSGTAATGAATVTGNIAVSGTVDGRDVAADGTKLDGIETAATADQTNAEIRTAVEAASDSNVFTDADHSKLNAIEASATADQTAAEIRTLVESASDSNVFTDADHTKLNAIEASATADQTASEIKTLIASSPLDASHLATNSVTTDEIADAELTTLAGMQSGTASILAGSTALAATTGEINAICDGKTVQTTISDTDASYPTSGAVVDYVAAQIAPLGGLEVIANEDSFPTQPASGVVISIADAGGIVVNGSGVSTTARTSGNGSDNVTINGFPSSLYNTTLSANLGLMVSSTGSSNTYTYHKLLGKEDDIKQLSDDINDFNARYRVAASAPSSSLDDGDLWFDTTNDKMKVYNATGSSWDDVATVGDFFINTLSSSGNTGGGSATFNGTAYRFVLSSPPTSAQQLIVSVNGVIQKPNAGSSQPSEGFAVSGNDIIFSAAPPSGADYFITTQGSAVSIGTPSDNTVSTAKLQNLAVTGDKIATNLDLADNKKIRFGTGNDLEIYHSGSHSYIKDTGTGYLLTLASGFAVQNAAGTETILSMSENGSVDLYYDDSKKLETTSTGASVTGELDVSGNIDLNSDTAKIFIGDGNDLQIYHDGSHSYLNNYGGSLRFSDAGSEKFRISGTGTSFNDDIFLSNDNDKINIGAGSDLQIYHNGSHSYLVNNTGSFFIQAKDGEHSIKCAPDAQTELYYDNSKKLETLSNGIEVSGHVYLADSNELRLGNVGSGGDLKIYHNGSHSYIKDTGTGNLILTSSQMQIINAAEDEMMARFDQNGAVELYYDGVKRFETSATGTYFNERQLGIGGGVKTRTYGGSVGMSADTSHDTLLTQNFGNDDMVRIEYAYNWNDGDGGAWGSAIAWNEHDSANMRTRFLGEEISSPGSSVEFIKSGNSLSFRFTVLSNVGMNGEFMIIAYSKGCDLYTA